MKCLFPVLVKDKYGVLQPVPCGSCRVCRINKSRQWSIRIKHESLFFQNRCCFLTLTYDDEHLPLNGSLVKKDFQDWMKRFRKDIGSKVRYFGVGEYGKKSMRPHYHVILFGVPVGSDIFKDRIQCIKKGRLNGFYVKLDSWKLGFCHVGTVTDQSAYYVSGYVMKKIAGKKADYYSERGIEPEFALMSRRPGLGLNYVLRANVRNHYLHNPYATIGNSKYALPRFYVEKLGIKKKFDKDDFEHRFDNLSIEQAEQLEKNIEKKYHLLGKDERI